MLTAEFTENAEVVGDKRREKKRGIGGRVHDA